jgi:hypothetical protein
VTRQPKFLVITMFAGENEIDQCKASVAAQEGVEVTHEIIAGLDNIAAHHALYQMIMDRAQSYDLFVKLDGDMVLNRPTALRELADIFNKNKDIDQMVRMVHDHYTNRAIHGVHSFSPRVRWDLASHDRLFVDPDPKYEGRLLRDPASLKIFVDHAPDPSRYQAFHFGFHRMLKLVQMIQNKKAPRHIRYQLAILQDVETHFYGTGHKTLGLAILAADLVRKGDLSATTGDKKNAELEAAFRSFETLSDGQVRRRVKAGWLARAVWYWLKLREISREEQRK